MTPAAVRHYEAACKAWQRNQVDVWWRHLEGLVAEMKKPQEAWDAAAHPRAEHGEFVAASAAARNVVDGKR